MRHTPDALLIRNENKAIPIGEAIRRLEVVSIAFDVVRLAITILVPQQRQMSGLLLRNNDIVIGKNEQSARVLQARDKWRSCKALHHPRRLSRIWYEQRSACGDWITFRRQQIFRLNEKASAQLLIGIASGIGRYALLGRTALLGSGHGTNHPKSQCSRCDCADNASHEILPVSTFSRTPSRRGGGRAGSRELS